jgi:LysM repeat protein
MLRKLLVIVLSCSYILTGCARVSPKWRDEAKSAIIGVYATGAQKEFPVEYGNALNMYTKGEEFLKEDEVETADEFFHFSWIKARLLAQELAEVKARRDEEARLKAETERRETERLQALKEIERKASQEKEELKARKLSEKSKPIKERPLPASHTVKRGETLPQIASKSDVYNDYKLWPLLYRANRDQISDPRHIWPGQVLRIPRNLSREEMAEARRYAQERPIN